MARRSAKISRKRSPSTVVATRQSKRLKAEAVSARTKARSQVQVKQTPKKSKHFGLQATRHSNRNEDYAELSGSEQGSEYLSESSYEDDGAAAISTPAEPKGERRDSGEEDTMLNIRPGTTKRRSTLETKLPTGRELLKEGVRAGLGPGKEVRIKLPKAREAGDIPYQDDKIHPNTLLFLRDLRSNNDRDWLKLHDKDYRNAQRDFETYVERLTEKVIEKDDTIPELPMKDLVPPNLHLFATKCKLCLRKFHA
ncbi:hypothetical protein GP486_001639 [Trichoglossum hirsutum]|uniref:Uncharacterized protein n=1 Tax=Trichoglossum hirsutum TaxID=265104 RepID=A0A9P8RSI4_9PEZI|nr:hypothetical protein GP486_001639 [Trichoglossum hirsutum]